MTPPHHHEEHGEHRGLDRVPDTPEARRGKLIGQGIALGTGLGSAIGLLLGLLLFDHFVFGMPIGMPVGVAVGAALGSRRAAAERQREGGSGPGVESL